nr:immunoglobulin heavy chain junction region [Mus musculus]
RSLTSEDSAV